MTDKLREKAHAWLDNEAAWRIIGDGGQQALGGSLATLLSDVRREAIEECESKVRAILEDHIDRRQGLLTAAGPILRALKEAKGD